MRPRASARRARRPNVTLLCRRIVADMARKLPPLAKVRASRILFVAGEARRASRATIRPLAGSRISLKGRRVLYCVTLRPKFFRSSTPEQRVETLLHELLHIPAAFDGSLDPARRHSTLSKAKFEVLLRPLVKQYLAAADAELLAGLAHDGEVLARQWLERPTGRASTRRPYTEKNFFFGPVQMITRRQLHS